MKHGKKIGAALLLALLLGAAYAYRVPLALALARKVALGKLAADAKARLPDGLHVALCGAGSPFPDERRAGPCTLVIAGPHQMVFDAGAGASRNIGKMGFNQGEVEAIFLTHFHSDHIDGLGELLLQRWVSNANRAPLPVYGPDGVEAVLGGFMQAYQLDRHYRVAHHGDASVAASGFGGIAKPFALQPGHHTVLLQEADLEVAAFLVDHSPVHPAVGYRIRYKDRSLVLSGDTRQSAAVLREAQGVDLLVHEALSVPLVGMLQEAAGAAGRPHLKKIFGDIIDYHATPDQAAETARDAHVGYLLLNHIVPTLPPLPGLEGIFLGDARQIFSGPLRVGVDGDLVSLPAGSKAIEQSQRF
ncbi:MAG: MBL fold metallo-hydrolase [Rhodoferax sp.]